MRAKAISATAVREYGRNWYEGELCARELGKVWSNPAILSNTTFTILIEIVNLKTYRGI